MPCEPGDEKSHAHMNKSRPVLFVYAPEHKSVLHSVPATEDDETLKKTPKQDKACTQCTDKKARDR